MSNSIDRRSRFISPTGSETPARDGTLRGDELRGIALWRDADSDGISDPGEVQPVAAHGIAALSCRHERHPSGMPYSPAGCVLEDGSTRPTYDWIVPARGAARE